MTADQIRSLQPALAALLQRFRPCFKRVNTFAHWERYLLGLITDLKRKSIEPIALAAGVAVRTLQEFLSQFVWDHGRVNDMLQHMVMDEHGSEEAIGVIAPVKAPPKPALHSTPIQEQTRHRSAPPRQIDTQYGDPQPLHTELVAVQTAGHLP